MEDIIKKISDYDFLNTLLPGFLVIEAFKYIFNTPTIQTNDIISRFFIYFSVGLFVNRLGSLFVEPFLKKINFIKFETYEKYCLVRDNHKELNTLTMYSNLYRSLVSSCSVLTLCAFIGYLFHKTQEHLIIILALLIIFFVFLVAYKKQTEYIASFVRCHISADSL